MRVYRRDARHRTGMRMASASMHTLFLSTQSMVYDAKQTALRAQGVPMTSGAMTSPDTGPSAKQGPGRAHVHAVPEHRVLGVQRGADRLALAGRAIEQRRHHLRQVVPHVHQPGRRRARQLLRGSSERPVRTSTRRPVQQRAPLRSHKVNNWPTPRCRKPACPCSAASSSAD